MDVSKTLTTFYNMYKTSIPLSELFHSVSVSSFVLEDFWEKKTKKTHMV